MHVGMKIGASLCVTDERLTAFPELESDVALDAEVGRQAHNVR
jgi:hypothetical protein